MQSDHKQYNSGLLERTFSITNLSKYPGTRQPVLSISERFVDSFYKANPTQQRNSIVSGQNNLKIINLYKKKNYFNNKKIMFAKGK